MLKNLVVMVSTLLLHGAAAAQDTGITATAYGTVNVRSGPGVQYEIVGQLSADERVPVIGRDSESSGWLQIVLDDAALGWVASFAVLLDGDAGELPVVVVNSIPVDDENPATVTAYGLVNVRGGPGMDYDIVGQLDVDDTAAIIGRSNEENDWLYIETDDLAGWVAYFTVSIDGNINDLPILVVPGTGEGVALEEEVIQTLFNVRLRAEPNASADILIIVPFESNVTPLARSADRQWIYVVYQDIYGWGVARLFDMSAEQIEELPLFNRGMMATATPTAQATSDPDES